MALSQDRIDSVAPLAERIRGAIEATMASGKPLEVEVSERRYWIIEATARGVRLIGPIAAEQETFVEILEADPQNHEVPPIATLRSLRPPTMDGDGQRG